MLFGSNGQKTTEATRKAATKANADAQAAAKAAFEKSLAAINLNTPVMPVTPKKWANPVAPQPLKQRSSQLLQS